MSNTLHFQDKHDLVMSWSSWGTDEYFILKTDLFDFLAVIDICCCTRAFSSCRAALHCGVWTCHCSGFSCGAQALGRVGFSSWGFQGSVSCHRPSCSAACGFKKYCNQASLMGSSQTKYQTSVSRIARADLTAGLLEWPD